MARIDWLRQLPPLSDARSKISGSGEGFTSFTKVDKNGVVWTISGILSYQADAPSYSPPGQVFGDSIDNITQKIDNYASTHAPPSGMWSSLGTYIDANGGIWVGPEDRWKKALDTWPPPDVSTLITIGERYLSRSFSYGAEPVTVTSPTEFQLKGKIDAYAAGHKLGGAIKAPTPTPGPIPSPSPVPAPTSPTPPPIPPPTPPTPTPMPSPTTAPSSSMGLGLTLLGVGTVALLVAAA